MDFVDQDTEPRQKEEDFENKSEISSPDLADGYAFWSRKNNALIPANEILTIFQELASIYGFQNDNVMNMYDFFMVQLDSRSSRMSCYQALRSLFSDYIAGEHSNYRKWYFVTQYKLVTVDVIYQWKKNLLNFTEIDMVKQVALYLLIWGESSNIRYMPECLCFLFFTAKDYIPEEKSDIIFLDHVITPIYNLLQLQTIKRLKGKDHSNIIGYDDFNLFFWHSKNISLLKLIDGTKLKDIPTNQKYANLSKVNWKKSIYKTYKEKRSWFHLLTNFNRIWNIHFSTFWYFTSYNSPTLYTKDYVQLLDNQPPPQLKFTIVSLGGALVCLIQILATIFEFAFVPRKWPSRGSLYLRLFLLILLLVLNLAPSIYILYFIPLDVYSKSGYYISIAQLTFSVLTSLYLSIVPSSRLFFARIDTSVALFAVPSFDGRLKGRLISISLWTLVFIAKFLESYFFLTLAIKDSLRVLSVLQVPPCFGDLIIGNFLCKNQNYILMSMILFADVLLYLLDTYLWYIIFCCILSSIVSCNSGFSIFTPWKSVFSGLPNRLHSAFIFENKDDNTNYFYGVKKIWNSIVLSMYRENHISLKQTKNLVYQTESENPEGPLGSSYFELQEDTNISLLKEAKEAKRRISFFSKSLYMKVPQNLPIEALPNFTVIIPHYSEKILLNSEYLLKVDKSSKITPLEYIRNKNLVEWENFVQDAKIMDQLTKEYEELESDPTKKVESGLETSSNYDIPFNCMGFKDFLPQNVLRTRIWASLRAQTLYRTITGFMNYQKAIQLLYCAENDYHQTFGKENLLRKKCRILVAMQKYFEFSDHEKEDADLLFAAFPDLLVAAIEKKEEGEQLVYYSTLLDISQKLDDGNYKAKYRIRLPGNPILGDGKADNQNSSIVFFRGEYLQVVDSNQDNYLEECLKIKSVLSEFEEYDLNYLDDYDPSCPYSGKRKIAIVGAREYIFSENLGVLGDVAASKEETFGTLFARSLSVLEGKLHYGHPDLMNGIFMITRGGISKAQKGLHLNEDIYAGMNAIARDGKIKHCDYYQCGKGRDMGFSTILNFTRKIGAGMGEQLLSREHYFFGTNLSIDRLLTFYYAHPGFHLNNLLIVLSVQAFMVILLNFGSLVHESILCKNKPGSKITDLEEPLGCSNLKPIFLWVKHYVLSVVVCFILSFTPVFVHLLLESGPIYTFKKIGTHLICLSPLFEVFVCQIYARALSDDMTYGGAKYVGTDRGIAIKRVPFSVLYSNYALDSVYTGGTYFLTLIFSSLTIWQPCLLWFWITVLSLLFAPFAFNPHQYLIGEFILDYREFIRWLSRGNVKGHTRSWVTHMKEKRSAFIGYKRSKSHPHNYNIPSRWNVFVDQILRPLANSTAVVIPYLFINSQYGVKKQVKTNVLVRLAILVAFPIIFNAIILIFLGGLSLILGLVCNPSNVIASIAHLASVITFVLLLQITFILEGESFTRSIVLFIAILNLNAFLFKLVTYLLTKEYLFDNLNRTWWSGKLWKSGLRFLTIPLMLREFIVKILEQNLFAVDFMYGHFLLFAMFPLTLIPFIDKLHSTVLIWVSPFKFMPKVYGRRENKLRKRRIFRYGALFITMFIVFISLIILPIYLDYNSIRISKKMMTLLPPFLATTIQPSRQNYNYTGELAGDYVLRSAPEKKIMSTIR